MMLFCFVVYNSKFLIVKHCKSLAQGMIYIYILGTGVKTMKSSCVKSSKLLIVKHCKIQAQGMIYLTWQQV